MEYLPFIAVLAFSAFVLLALSRFWKVDLDTALKVGGGLATILSLLVGVIEFTAGQREQDASAQQTEYIAATQQLSEAGSARPMAGIAALAQLAEHNTERTWLMTESLSAFLRATAPRPTEDLELLGARSQMRLAPYDDPPCKANAGPNQEPKSEQPYLYRSCTATPSLFRSNLAVQTALTALATRNRENETKSNAPVRFRVQLDSANGVPVLPEAKNSRYYTLKTIAAWHREWKRDGTTASDRQLLAENQESVLTAYPEVLRRPWLNLSNSELLGLDAGAGFLEGGNLSRSDLSFGMLARANLAVADLSGSWLVGADLFAADLRGASLQEADVRGADLGRANLSQSWMSGGTFHRANFWQADLSKAFLLATDMTEVETMSGARLDDIVAYRADFSRAKIAGKETDRVCMERAFLEEAKLRCAVLNGADLRDADLEGADFTNAQLIGADLRGARFSGTIVTGVDLSRADLRGVDLTHAVGKPASIHGALVDEGTKLPWSDGQTEMRPDFLGVHRILSALHRCTTVRSSDDEIDKVLENAPVRSLMQMRDTCPPQTDPYRDAAARALVNQATDAAGPAKLEVVSVPDGADVELDGVFAGSTPSLLGTSPGEHTLKISKAGYFIWERKLRLTTGTVRIAPELEAVTGAAGK
jgi:uncharacterized protein YjbI with pentapeptide repeats